MRDTIDMAREADLIDDTYASDWYVYQLKAFEALVRADERDRAMKDLQALPYGRSSKYDCMDAIRARGNT
jgi:hypothetical protein